MPYVDVLCPEYNFDTGCNEPKAVGSQVYVGRHAGPLYEIVAINADRAWITCASCGDTIVPVSRLRSARE